MSVHVIGEAETTTGLIIAARGGGDSIHYVALPCHPEEGAFYSTDDESIHCAKVTCENTVPGMKRTRQGQGLYMYVTPYTDQTGVATWVARWLGVDVGRVKVSIT